VNPSYTIDYLLHLLSNESLLNDVQVREIQAGSPALAAKLRESQRMNRGFDDSVSPAEVIGAFGVICSDGKILDEDRVMEILAANVGLPYFKIDPLKLNAQLITTSLPRRFSKKSVVLPLERNGEKLKVAVDNPFNLSLLDEIKATLGLEVELVVSCRSDILKTITEIYGFRTEVDQASLKADVGVVDIGNFEQLVQLKSEDEIEASDHHIINAVEYLLRYAMDQRASDIHIEPKRDHTMVRLRIDGVLHDAHKMPKNVHPAVISRIKTMARMDIAEKRRPQDGRIKTDFGDREVEIRISTMPVAFGEKVVLRIFDPEILMQSLDEMGFYPKELALFKSFIARPHGIILVTGPTGSGKTTTLYSALKSRATSDVNCATIEDPIEMVIEQFNQTAVNPRAGITFATALRTLLRQDPDIIMVGEIRDAETAENAIQAALTGHLVMSTLHTNDTASSVNRIIDLGIEPFLVGSTLIAVVAQRLLRRVCAGCKTERVLTRDECSALRMVLPEGEAPTIKVYDGKGCHLCRGTGLHGRIGVYEIMPVTSSVRDLINARADGPQILRAARNDGMMTLRECAIRRMVDGMTTFGEVLRVTVDTGE
jgi:general secretion pathway protein E